MHGDNCLSFILFIHLISVHNFIHIQEQLENGEEEATCPSCSLIVKVIYNKVFKKCTSENVYTTTYLIPPFKNKFYQSNNRYITLSSLFGCRLLFSNFSNFFQEEFLQSEEIAHTSPKKELTT